MRSNLSNAVRSNVAPALTGYRGNLSTAGSTALRNGMNAASSFANRYGWNAAAFRSGALPTTAGSGSFARNAINRAVASGTNFNSSAYGPYRGSYAGNWNNLYRSGMRYSPYAAGYGGYGRYGYAGSAVYGATRLIGLALGYGYGYGGYGYPYGGYGGYGYGYPYGGYYGYPWGLVGSIVSRAVLGFGPYRYGYGYGGYYGGSSYSSYSSPTYVTNVTNYPEVAVPIDDGAVAAPVPADDFATLGEQAFRSGDYADAVRQWQHAIVDDPQNATLALMIGQALFAQGKYDEAAGAVQAAMQNMPPEQWNVVVANAAELYGSPTVYADQVGILETAAAQSPSPDKYFLLGYHHGYLGDAPRAVKELDQGLALAPQDAVMRQLRDLMQARVAAATAPQTDL